ncbi:MFS transporter [Crenobacter sp. SG2305]|uniref:MFS transporter n=1 Tax=Crenobacter oryzisoli TaxID=3056844 RepID=UPI0025AAB870|nr:MFS transporter [Crenobacter sp. SG2305]MDN0084035.1 MFS transporter [Crenobacter sp. SG2305]
MNVAVAHPRLILATVCAIALMSTAGVAMPYPILAPIFVERAPDGFNHFLGLPAKLLLGIALAANPLGVLVGSSFVGALSDRLGRRRVLLGTLTLTFIGYGLTAVALSSKLYVLFVLTRFLTGLTEGNVPVARAILADLHPVVDRSRSFALLNAMLYMGWLVGPMIGGFTLPLGESVPFWLASLAMLPCLAILAWLLPETGMVAGGEHRPLWQLVREQHSFRLLGRDPLLAALFWMQLAFALGVNAFYDFYPVWLVEFAGFSSAGIALVTAGLCLVMSSAAGLVGQGRAGDVLQRARRHAALFAGGLLLLSLTSGWPGIVLIVVIGLPLSLYNTLLPVWCSERFDAFGQGSVMGLLSTIFCCAAVLISLFGSVLALFDTRLVMLLGGATCLLATLRLGSLLQRARLAGDPT